MISSRSVRDLALRVLIPAVVLVGLLVPVVALSSRLPDQVATHWSGLIGDRAPDGHVSLWLWAALVALLWCASWAALQPLMHSLADAPERAFGVYSLGGVLLAGHALVLGLNLDQSSWHQARLPSGGSVPVILAVLVVGAGGGCLGWLLGRGARPQPDPPVRGVRATGERTAWSGSARNRWVLVAAPLVAVLAFTRTTNALAGVALAAGLAGILVALSRISLTAGPRGVMVAFGPWGWPRREIALVEIRGARSMKLAALAYRGFGSRRFPGGTAWIVRSGDALDLELTNGRRFVVTVDGSQQAAALINDYLAEAPTSSTETADRR